MEGEAVQSADAPQTPAVPSPHGGSNLRPQSVNTVSIGLRENTVFWAGVVLRISSEVCDMS